MNTDRSSSKFPPDTYLYSFSSRCNSPIFQKKQPKTPFEFTDQTKTGSFMSINTSVSRFSSMSGTHEGFHRAVEDPLGKLKEKIGKIQEESVTAVSDKISFIDVEKGETEIEVENGIPTLRWCAYCKAETATEVCLINGEKTFWSSLAIFLSGGVFGCFLLPYAMDSCKDVQIRCHKCKHTVESQSTSI